jgi:hypothetical protein
MPDAERLFARMERTKSGWGWSHLDTVYTGFGFEKEEGSNHTVYIHPDHPELRATVARHNKLAPGYSQTAVKLIRRLREFESEAEANDEPE